MYAFDPVNVTDNNGLQDIVEKLELIYTTIDWPFQVCNLLFYPEMSNVKSSMLFLIQRKLPGSQFICKFAAVGKVQSRLVAVCWSGRSREVFGKSKQSL